MESTTDDIQQLDFNQSSEITIWNIPGALSDNSTHDSFSISERDKIVADEQLSQNIPEQLTVRFPVVKKSSCKFPKRSSDLLEKDWPCLDKTYLFLQSFLKLRAQTPGVFDEAVSTTDSPLLKPTILSKVPNTVTEESSQIVQESRASPCYSQATSAYNKPPSSRDCESMMKLINDWHSGHDLREYIERLKKVEQQTHDIQASNRQLKEELKNEQEKFIYIEETWRLKELEYKTKIQALTQENKDTQRHLIQMQEERQNENKKFQSKQKTLVHEIKVLKKELRSFNVLEDKINELCVMSSKSEVSIADEEEFKKKS